MSNPLTYPSKGETLKDQYRAIPSESTMKKLNSKGKRPVMGSIQLENMIMDNLSKVGILVMGGKNKADNP